jgi:hypothetical protein
MYWLTALYFYSLHILLVPAGLHRAVGVGPAVQLG